VSKTSRSSFDVLRLTLRAQPRSRNFLSGHCLRIMIEFAKRRQVWQRKVCGENVLTFLNRNKRLTENHA